MRCPSCYLAEVGEILDGRCLVCQLPDPIRHDLDRLYEAGRMTVTQIWRYLKAEGLRGNITRARIESHFFQEHHRATT